MDAILVLALLDKSLVLITPVAALMLELHIMLETHSLAKMDVIPVLAPLEKSPVRKIPVDAIMKVTHTMKEILSLA